MPNAYLERLKAERHDLDLRVSKLSTFISGDTFLDAVNAEGRALLVIQLRAMNTYLAVLNRRLEIEFPDSADQGRLDV